MKDPAEWESSPAVFRIPEDHHHCTLANFVFTPAARDAVIWFGRELHAGNAPHLILTGLQGNGKSHLSVALYRHAVWHFGTQDCWWGDIPDFCNRVKRGMDEGISEDLLIDSQEAVKFVAMDDVWGRPLTPWEMDNVVFRILSAAISNKAALVVTTNYSKAQIGERLAPHEMDRLLQHPSKVIEFKGNSWRTQTGGK